MRLLFRSDTQADFSNLQECEASLDELLVSAAKYKPDAIIHAGDMKEAYSPVDLEVVKYCVREVRRVREAGYRYIILLGNHDRVSQSAESKNWLDVLQAAGAEAVTKPTIKKIAGAAVALLPYMGLSESLIRGAAALRRGIQGQSGPKLLVFHCEVAGAVLNASGRMGSGPTPEQLGFGDYDACFGGHIHSHQPVGDNGCYIGAPFCQDWGDANSSRGHLLVTVRPFVQGSDVPLQSDPLPDWNVEIKQLRTAIPHWYDIEYLEEWGLTPEPGAYIRSKVKVTSKRITDQLLEEEERIRRKYGDVRIHTVPELVDDSAPEILIKGSTDREKIEQYVATTITDHHRFEPARSVTYMASKLAGTSEGAAGGDLRFRSVEAENVLVFEKVKMRLAKLGLVLIRGENKDWPGRSNGTGKTSLLSLVPVAMFGEVPNKKQKHDDWAYERDEEPASVRLRVQAGGRELLIGRGRRPHYLTLEIDGDDRSSGLRGTGENETQGRIEKATGYDLRMLMNAVYIDQAVANGFVFGTPGGRMDLINRFQNCERFEAGLELVSKDIKKWELAVAEANGDVVRLDSDIDGLAADIKELEAATESNWTEQLAAEQKDLAAAIDEHAAIAAVAKMYEEMRRTIDDLESDGIKETGELERMARVAHALNEKLEDGRRLVALGRCPTCTQPTRSVGTEMVQQSKAAAAAAKAKVAEHTESLRKLNAKVAAASKKIDAWTTKKTELEHEMERSRSRIADLEKAAAEEGERNRIRAGRLQDKQRQLVLKRRLRKAVIADRQAMGVTLEMMEYAKKAFHRSGIPLYMSMALCPLLNRAADEYSEVFTDGRLKIAFRVDDGAFAVDVINPVGSATVKGQSQGESAMAGIIAAFSIREAAPKTNMLILDEPGTGLDPEGCRQFAKGLIKLKERFETILLVTHSPHIYALLSGETVYTVEKSGGRSRLFLS